MLQRLNVFDLLKEVDNINNRNGMIRELVDKKIMSTGVANMYEIWLMYDSYLRTGYNSTDARDKVMVEFDISKAYFYKIKNKMSA